MSADISDAIDTLTAGDPSYGELVGLYNDLRTAFTRSAERTVCRRALAGVVGEMIDYLDFVEAHLQASVGVDRASERERLLDALTEPRGTDAVERVDRLVKQWESIDRYTYDDLREVFEHA